MRQQVRGVAQEVQESFLIDPRPMNPFEATLTVEYEAALEPGRARAVAKEAAILVDAFCMMFSGEIPNNVTGASSCLRCRKRT
jgi:hypothetical protein